MITHQDNVVCDLPIEAITTDVHADRQADPNRFVAKGSEVPTLSLDQLKQQCETQLAMHNNTSKRYVYRYYDNAVRGHTVIYPGEADSCGDYSG